MKKLKYQNFWLFIGLLQVVVTYYLCLIPSGHGPPPMEHLDKIVHFSIYTTLCFWFNTSLSLNKSIPVFFSLLLMGISIELLQKLTPTRSFDLLDIVANFLGLIAGYFLALKGPNQILRKIEHLFIKKALQ